jgi:uncharacterized sporulation protein YeaH/YhbH (DUF444 family)/spore cortex formation protein SpoVR/YcgB (stage V sporulation)
MNWIALFISILTGSPAFAVKASNPLIRNTFRCEKLLESRAQDKAGPIEFHTSGKDDKTENQLRTDAQIITDIAHDLGLATPPHKIYFVPDEQLNVMAAMGGQPVPTWMDGLTLSNSMGSVMGVLEFVTPGCPTCRSYYSDKTTKVHQRAVLMHVMGHNDVALTSMLEHQRDVDPPADGMYLAQTLEKAYLEHDHDEVALFAQHLNSIKYLQDFTYASVEKPEKFAPVKLNKATDKLPWAETANGLQALTQQLDPGAPQWKHDVMKWMERQNRIYPAYANTKILNEGWATMMQYLIARHAPWNTSKDIIEYATLMAGVAYPSLSNPYWIGVMGWYNLYTQFRRHDDLKGRSEKEIDRAFIAWARKTYATMSDYEWLQLAIDQEFCDRWNLFLYRKTQPDEMDPNVPREQQALIAMSRSPERIQKYLIRRLTDRSLMIPRIMFENPQYHDASTLTFKQELIHDLPIEPISAAKTLFVISQTFGKRAKLFAYVNPDLVPQGSSEDLLEKVVEWQFQKNPGHSKEEIREWVKTYMTPDQMAAVLRSAGESSDQPVPVTIEVDPDGHVSVYQGVGDTRAPVEKLQAVAQGLVHAYKEDITTSLHEGLAEQIRAKWAEPSRIVADKTTNPAMEIVQYAPYAGQALQELIKIIEVRFPRVFKKAVNNGQITPSKNGVRLKVLPEIPQFGYDARYKARKWRQKPPGRIDHANLLPMSNWEEDDNGSILTAGDKLPGDKFAAPPPSKGQGKGDGEGEDGDDQDQSGDPSDNEGQEPNPGGDSSGSDTDLEVPLELYGKLLAEELELPNLRRTEGQSDEVRLVKKGSIRKPNGDLLWHHIAMRAWELEIATRKKQNLPVDNLNPFKAIKNGMKYIDSTDYIVRDKIEKPKPDFDAVLVVNVDLTGSMMGERIKMAKNLVFNLKALLSAVYKNVKIHYVGFDNTAQEYPEAKIWTAWKGGSTAYAPALEVDQKIFENYPTSRWNRYVLTIGDGETADGDRYVDLLSQMSKGLQYAGLAITTNGQWGGYEQFLQTVDGFKGRWPWVGTTVMTDESQIMKAIKDLFPKGPAK